MHWVISDLHGQLAIWREVEKMLKPGEDQIIVLGDCVDRGPYPFQTLQAVYESPLKPILLLGNHEDIFSGAMIYIQEHNGTIPDESVAQLLRKHGTNKTVDEWARLTNMDYSWIEKILDLPIETEYFNEKLGIKFLMTHSGYIPKNLDSYEECNKAIWDREHIFELHDNVPENTIIVHGHTIIPYVKERMFWSSDEEYKNRWEITERFTYCHGQKIDIDACAFETNKAILFNLDTLVDVILDTDSITFIEHN